MSRIFELLGYPASDRSDAVEASRKQAFCPYMCTTCDGGGNRYMSGLLLTEHPELKEYFSDVDGKVVQSGICSIQLNEGDSPWIICPRRMLYMGHHANHGILNSFTQKQLLGICDFKAGDRIGIWSEAKIKYQNKNDDDFDTAFDYTFDYVLMPIANVPLEEALAATKLTETELLHYLDGEQNKIISVSGIKYITDFPVAAPVIVEVMTSSTSGGNKKNRSCIPQAFEDCILEKKHSAPGINYRQVWARMASQLIVKSQAAIAWGGKTIWVLQDLLSNYISASTALNLHHFESRQTSEVNILEFSYGSRYEHVPFGELCPLSEVKLYAGPIKGEGQRIGESFQDIVLASVCPPREVLITALLKKRRAAEINID